jgi:hypothetical protein
VEVSRPSEGGFGILEGYAEDVYVELTRDKKMDRYIVPTMYSKRIGRVALARCFLIGVQAPEIAGPSVQSH